MVKADEETYILDFFQSGDFVDQNHAAQALCFSYGVSGAIATFY